MLRILFGRHGQRRTTFLRWYVRLSVCSVVLLFASKWHQQPDFRAPESNFDWGPPETPLGPHSRRMSTGQPPLQTVLLWQYIERLV